MNPLTSPKINIIATQLGTKDWESSFVASIHELSSTSLEGTVTPLLLPSKSQTEF